MPSTMVKMVPEEDKVLSLLYRGGFRVARGEGSINEENGIDCPVFVSSLVVV